MRYRIFDTLIECDRSLPFQESDVNAAPAVRIAQVGSLEDSVDLERLGELRGARCAIQYGGWLVELRPDTEEIAYQRRLLGDFDLPLFHVLERLAVPLHLTISRPAYHCLHGSAVVTDEHAWVVTGETGAGKSTTAFELARQFDVRIGADETVVVDLESGDFLPGSPAIRLDRPVGSVPEARENGAIDPRGSKRWFRLDDRYLARGAHPLAGIVYLRVGEAGGVDGPDLQRLGGGDGLSLLLEQSFDFDPAPADWKRRRFRNASGLARRVPIYRYTYRRSPDGTPDHISRLWNELRGLPGRS